MRYLVVGIVGNVQDNYLDIILATDDLAKADKAMAENYQCRTGQIICIDTVTGINLSNDFGPKEWEPDDSNVTCPQVCSSAEELWTFKLEGLKEPPSNYLDVKAKYKLIKYMSSYFGNHHLEGDEVKHVWVDKSVDESSIYGGHGKHSGTEYVMIPSMGLPPLGMDLEPLSQDSGRVDIGFIQYSP